MIAVKLVMFSAFDMATFLPIARQVLGRGISGRADSEKLSAESHNMLCVAGLIDGDIEDVDQLYYAAYLIAASELDMPDIIQVAGMPHIWVDSKVRGVRAAVLSGSLPAWRDAIYRGCASDVEPEVRKVYNKIYVDLTQRSLDAILGKANRQPQDDDTFLLELK